MNNVAMLNVIRRHTLEVLFQVMRVAVNYRKWPKHLEIIALHPKSILASPAICYRTYLEKLRLLLQALYWASRSPVYCCCFYNRMKSLWNSRQALREPIFFSHFSPKFARSRILHQNPLFCTLPNLFLSSCDSHPFEACGTR